MAISFGGRCLKYTIFAFNFIFFIMGVICFGLGCWLVFDQNALNVIADASEKVESNSNTSDELRMWASKWRTISYLGMGFIMGGAVIVLIAFMGCCGAMKEWRPLLICYAFLLMLLLALELAVVVYAAMNQGRLERHVKIWLKRTLHEYNPPKSDNDTQGALKQAWDAVMIQMQCCGIESELDEFTKSKWYIQSGNRSRVPPACCDAAGPTKTDLVQSCHEKSRHAQGCYEKIKMELVAKHGVVIGVAVAIAVVQMVGIIMAFCLCNTISNDEEDDEFR